MGNKQYEIPTGDRVTISPTLKKEIKKRFQTDRENRFQLFLLSSGIRNKYLIKGGEGERDKYSEEFTEWYKKSGMKKLYGSLPNFTKYASCGEVVNYIANLKEKYPHIPDNPELSQNKYVEKYLNQLPLAVGTLYEISQLLKLDEDVFKLCLQFTPTRKSLDEPKIQWKTKKPSLINTQQSETYVREWKRNFFNPKEILTKKQEEKDKRTIPFITITCSEELFDFNKKTGEKLGCLDIEEVDYLYERLSEVFYEEVQQLHPKSNIQFRFTDNMREIDEEYLLNQHRADPARKILYEDEYEQVKKKRYKE